MEVGVLLVTELKADKLTNIASRNILTPVQPDTTRLNPAVMMDGAMMVSHRRVAGTGFDV